MQVTMDPKGRLIVPESIRKQAGILPGVPLEIRVREGRIEIEPSPRDVRLVRKGRLIVAVPSVPSQPLTAEIVERVLMNDLRRGEL
ncbi:MAG TPA: AbrB/MazE/SpoVT family DNA-binding domain-containing protein [Thermoanaerobaculia bacterium]|nr:AbrB/MazE/SpoVT family DNA-binding domain-containing protein [Thermoanaerobaculia bacterium]